MAKALKDAERKTKDKKTAAMRKASEEHLPVECASIAKGDVLYLVPKHICPTVNLADTALWVEDKDAGVACWRVNVHARAHPLLANDRPIDVEALDGSIPVLSEEDCEVPLAERAGWTRWWLVDPLDGTKEFIAGSAEFTVNVALIEQGEVRFGVVGIPASGTTSGTDGLAPIVLNRR